MHGPTQKRHEAEESLVRQALESASAWRELVDRYSPTIWHLCSSACPEAERETSFAEFWQTLSAEGGALLRRYDGRASLQSYLQFVAVEVFSRRIQALLRTEPSRGWTILEAFFSREITRQICSVAGSPRQLAEMGATPEDVQQDLALELGADGFRRLRAYDGRGSFAGFVRRVVRNLCLDWRRKQTGRRRLPKAVERMGELAQRAYELMEWNDCTEDDVRDHLRGSAPDQEIQEAVRRVTETGTLHRPLRRRVPAGSGLELEREPATSSPSTPEQLLLQEEKGAQRGRLLRLVEQVVARLPAQQQLYVRLRFFEEPPLTPRQIAEALGLKEADVYRMRQDVVTSLRVEMARSGVDRESFLLFEG